MSVSDLLQSPSESPTSNGGGSSLSVSNAVARLPAPSASGNPNIPGLGTIFTPSQAQLYDGKPDIPPTPTGNDVGNIWDSLTSAFKNVTSSIGNTVDNVFGLNTGNPTVDKSVASLPPPSTPTLNDTQLSGMLDRINMQNTQLSSVQKELDSEQQNIADLGKQIDTMKPNVDGTDQSSVDTFNNLVNEYNAKSSALAPKINDFQNNLASLKNSTDSYNAELTKSNAQKDYASSLFGDASQDPHGLWGAVWKDAMIGPKLVDGLVTGIFQQETTPSADVQGIEKNLPGGSNLLGDISTQGLGGEIATDLAIPLKIMTRFFSPILQGMGQHIAAGIIDIAHQAGNKNAFGVTPDMLQYTPGIKDTFLQTVGNTLMVIMAISSPEIADKLGLAGTSEETTLSMLKAVSNKVPSESFAPLEKIIGLQATKSVINGAGIGLLFGTAQVLQNGIKDPSEIASTIFKTTLGMSLLDGAIGAGSHLSEAAKLAYFKNVSDFYGVPKDFTVHINAINYLIDTKQISEEDGKSILKGFGFSDEQVSKMRSGESNFTISRPTQDLFEITDKPYWAKIKDAFGLKSETNTIAHNVKGTSIEESPNNDIRRIAKQFTPKEEPTFNDQAIKQNTIPIARHGDNLLDEKGISAGHDQPGLTASGRKQIEEGVVKDWKGKGIQNVISSDATRAKQSADIVSKAISAKTITDPRLRTQNIGDLANKPEDTVKPIVKDLINNHPDEKVGKTGESFNQFKKRFEEGYKSELAKHPNEKNAFMLHGDGEKLVRSDFGRNMAEYNKDGIEHGKTTEVPVPKGEEPKFNQAYNESKTKKEEFQNIGYGHSLFPETNKISKELGIPEIKQEFENLEKIPFSIGRPKFDSSGIAKIKYGNADVTIDKIDKKSHGLKYYKLFLELNGFSNYKIYYSNTLKSLENEVNNVSERHPDGYRIFGMGADYITDVRNSTTNEKVQERIDQAISKDVSNFPEKINQDISLDSNEQKIARIISKIWEINKFIPHGYMSNSSLRTRLFEEKNLYLEKVVDQLEKTNTPNIQWGKRGGVIYFDVDGRQISFHANLEISTPEYTKPWIGVVAESNPLTMTDTKYQDFINSGTPKFNQPSEEMQKASEQSGSPSMQPEQTQGRELQSTNSRNTYNVTNENNKSNDIYRPELPERLFQPQRVEAYIDRLKLRGIDPVELRAIITPRGTRAYGVSYGTKLGFEQIVEEFTEDHEVAHKVWDHRKDMQIFKDWSNEDWNTLDKTLNAKYGDVPQSVDMTQDKWVAENVMKDYQQYLKEAESGKTTTFWGKILEFFQRLYASMKRIFNNQKNIEEFYRITHEGVATEETNVGTEGEPQFDEQFKKGRIVDFRDIKGIKQFNEKSNKDITETKEFKDWFQGSKIVDEKGDPLVVYHGTTSDPFDTFDEKFIGNRDSGWFGKGFYFALTKGEASTYGGNVMSAYLNIKNPFVWQDHEDPNFKGYSFADSLYLTNLLKFAPELAKKINTHIFKTPATEENNYTKIGTEINLEDYKKLVDTESIPYIKEIYDQSIGVNKQKVIEYTFKGINGSNQIITLNYNGKEPSPELLKHMLFDKKYSVDIGDGLYGVERAIGQYGNEFTNALKGHGYDGTMQSHDGDEYVAFKVNQIAIKKAPPTPSFNEKAEKNPEFDSGNKLQDVRDALAHVEKRVGVKSVDINQLGRMLEREKMSLATAESNPTAYQKAYGRDKRPEYKTKIKELEGKIDKALVAPKIRVSSKNIELPEELYDRKLAIQMKQELLGSSPYADLKKYVAQSGEFKGQLPEISGKSAEEIKGNSKAYGKIKNKDVLRFIKQGDQIIQEAFSAYGEVPSDEEVREKMNQYLAEIEENKKDSKELSKDIKEYIGNARDNISLGKLGDQKDLAKSKDEAIAKRRAFFDEAQKKINAEEEKKQDIASARRGNFLKPEEKDTLGKVPLMTKAIKENHPGLIKAFTKYRKLMNEAKIIPLKHKNSMPDIDKLGTEAFDQFENTSPKKELTPKQQKQIKDFNDNLYELEKKNGFPNLKYRDTYLPLVFKGDEAYIEKAQRAKLGALGMTHEEIEKYLNGKRLSEDKSVHMKLNPFFSKPRFFENYAEAMIYGLLPKFNKMSDLLAYRESESLKTRASRGLVNDLTEAGELVAINPPNNWRVNKYGPEGIEGHYSSPVVSNFLDNYFKGYAELKGSGKAVVAFSELSKFSQRMVLSTGIPFTSFAPFGLTVLQRELARGNMEALSVILKSNSTDSTIKSLQKDYKYLEMMVRNDVPFHEGIAGLLPNHTLKGEIVKLSQQVKGSPLTLSAYTPTFGVIKTGLETMFGKKEFQNFLPLLAVQTFKSSYEGLIKQGVSDERAQAQAAEITRMTQGLLRDMGRSRYGQVKLNAVFMAPQYREGIINILGNMVNSMNPISRKMFFPPPEKGATGPGKAKYKYSFAGEDSPIRNPKYKNLRKLLLGTMILYGIYNVINKEKSGHYMWQNPTGKEFDFELPQPDGQIIFVTFMSSFFTIPRAIAGAGIALLQGDTATVEQKVSGVMNITLSTIVGAMTNKNYFGDPIYKPTDNTAQRFEKLAAYFGTEMTSPYIKALVNKISSDTTPTPTPLYQSIISAMGMPLTFSTQAKEETNDVFNAINQQAQNQSTANAKSAAETEYSNLKSDHEAADKFNQLLKSNPVLAAAVYKIAEQEKMGITSSDRAILQLTINNGDRAGFIYQEAMKLPKSERAKYLGDLINKKIVNNKVSNQITALIQSGGKSITPLNGEFPPVSK